MRRRDKCASRTGSCFLLAGGLASLILLAAGRQGSGAEQPKNRPYPALGYPTIGRIVRMDPRLEAIVPKGARIEVVASGFKWSEGPVWVPDEAGGYLLLSDVPENTIYKWKEGDGVSVWMRPSGYTGVVEYKGGGSNGLTRDPEGRLVLCEHGDRRVSRLEKDGGKKTLVDSYKGKRLNSPNDLVYSRNGDLYFTDPPYGLPKGFNDPRRELPFCGVYRLSRRGELTLLTDELTRPNGIVLSPDEKTLYVTNSDPAHAVVMAYELKPNGRLGKGRVLIDLTEEVKRRPGLPDGMTIDRNGVLYVGGPGGVWVIAPDGKPLGLIETGVRTANCCWGSGGSTLYITAHMYLCRIKLNTKGLGW